MTIEAPSEYVYPPDDVRRKQQRGWYFYDFANSTFSTTVITLFLGPYLTDVAQTAAGSDDGFVQFLGLDIRATSVFAFAAGLSVFLQVFILPFVGAVADRTEKKRELLGLFAFIGALATCLMFFVTGGNWLLGVVLLLIANVSFGCSIVVYNAFLPDIATPYERDGVSSRGWALGYVGGALLLVLNLAFFLSRDGLGIPTDVAVRICILSAGIWWAAFTLIPYKALRTVNPRPATAVPGEGAGASVAQLFRTLRGMRAVPVTLLFLVAYLFYNDGVQTVIALSATYGSEELGLGETTLIVAILIVQVIAIAGALTLGKLAYRFGAKKVILGSLVVWTLTVVIAFFLPKGSSTLFYVLAALIGFVLGGSQALSRSLFSQMIPGGKEAEYYGVYEISERGTSWIGPIVFAVVNQITGSYRLALFALIIFFVVGGLLLLRVNVRRGIIEAGNEVPASLGGPAPQSAA